MVKVASALLLLAVSLLALSSVASSLSIGDRLLRDYTVYESMPINASSARSAGWTISSTCNPDRGYKATYKGTGRELTHAY